MNFAISSSSFVEGNPVTRKTLLPETRSAVAVKRKRNRLLERIPKGGEVRLSKLDVLLDVPPEDFDQRLQEILQVLDRKEIRVVPDPVPPRPSLKEPAFFPMGGAYAQEVLSLPRLDREGEYKVARRYALVRARFFRALEKAGIDPEKEKDVLASFQCREVPRTPEGGPQVCPRLVKVVGPKEALRVRERCREFNQVRNEFIEGCLYIVLLTLSGFRFPGVARDDLIQEGNASLFRAVDRYDWRKGVRFRTYAEYWIRQAFLEAVYNQSRTVRIPAWVQKATRRIRKAQAQVAGRMSPGEGEVAVAEALGVDPGKVETTLRDNRKTVSLDWEPAGEEGGSLKDRLAAEGDASQAAEEEERSALLPQRIRELLDTLPPREKLVLQLRFGLDGEETRTLTEVGRRLGVSAERVRQIQANALRRLQEPGRRKRLSEFS